MRDLLREAVFGRLVHLVSRGHIFPPEERRDPYSIPSSASTSEVDEQPSGEDAEKGKDNLLIDFVDNDPEV